MKFTVLAYTRGEYTELQSAMHFAAVQEDGSPKPLQNGNGVLFAKADFQEGPLCGTTKILRKPWVFRLKDNTFGVVCLRRNVGGGLEAGKEHCVLLFTSPDLLSFQEVGLVPVAPEGACVTDARCAWDEKAGCYRLTWSDGTGYYTSVSKELDSFTGMEKAVVPEARLPVALPGAEEGCAVSLSQEEYEKILRRYSSVFQTGCLPVFCKAAPGEKISLPGQVTLTYSDGSVKPMPVKWEPFTHALPGVYTVEGAVEQESWPFPFLEERADPTIIRFGDRYYYMATDDGNGQTTLKIRGSDTIGGLREAEEHVIFTANPEGYMSGCLWAPEPHVVNGRLCVFFAAGNPHWYTVQCHVMVMAGGDPLDAASWETPQRCRTIEGGVLCPDGITLDMTCFTVHETPYVVWAQRVMRLEEQEFGNSDLYIASVDPEKPWQLTSEPVCICRPSYGWDRIDTTVDEGPFAVERWDDLFVTFAGSIVSVLYCVGLLHAKIGSDLLKPESWEELGYPILTSESVPGQLGPGHNSFAKDSRGNDLVVFHAKLPVADGHDPGMTNRHTGLRPVHWDAEGLPRLDMTPERELSPSFRIFATVEITNS